MDASTSAPKAPATTASPIGDTAPALALSTPLPRTQLTRPAASARNPNAPALSSRADPARSCVPDAVPAKAIPPASSAASALGTARPTSGRTSQGRSAPLGKGRDDEQAHSAAEA